MVQDEEIKDMVKKFKEFVLESASERMTPQLNGLIYNNNVDEFNIYVKSNGIDVNYLYGDGFTLLTLACCYNRHNIIKYLVEHGADVNLRDGSGYTPITSLCLHSENSSTISDEEDDKLLADSYKLLLDNGAKVSVADMEIVLPYTITCENRLHTLLFLIENGFLLDILRPHHNYDNYTGKKYFGDSRIQTAIIEHQAYFIPQFLKDFTFNDDVVDKYGDIIELYKMSDEYGI